MNEELKETLSLKAAYVFGAAHGLQHEMDAIRDMIIEWDLSYTSSLRRGYIVALLEKHGLFDQFKREQWPFGNTPAGERKRQRYLRIKQKYEDFIAGRAPASESELDEEDRTRDQHEALEFALEAHLRDFLARNLDRIEPGLHLYASDDQDGIEYPVEGGRIDLLAIDRAGKYVVFELKLSKGRNKALGQLLYYMGWVDEHLGKGPCRGFIIASEINDELRIAVSRAPDVGLARYKMSFAIERVSERKSLG
jgi:hypothetical protein